MTTVRGWIVAAVVFAATILIWNVLSGALSALMLLFTATLLSAGLRPIVDRMTKRIPFGAAAGIAFCAVILSVAAITLVLVQPVGAELVKLVQAMPTYVASLQEQLAAAQRYVQNDQMAHQLAKVLADNAGGALGAIGNQLIGGPRLVATIFADAGLILLLAIGWMLASDELEQSILGLMRPDRRADWHAAFADIGAKLSAYVEGVVLNGTVVGVVMGASLALLGIPYALLLGVTAAIFQAIPMIGAVISGPIILIVVLATSGWTKMLAALAIFAVVQVLDQNVLSPTIFGKRVQLSFLLIIVSTVVGGTLLGIAGAFLAVPAAAILQVLFVRIVAPAIRRANGVPETEKTR